MQVNRMKKERIEGSLKLTNDGYKNEIRMWNNETYHYDILVSEFTDTFTNALGELKRLSLQENYY